MIDQQTQKDIEQTRSKYEFLTFILLKDTVIVGIIQNETPKLMMIYQLDAVRDPRLKKKFLEYGDEWWWGRNQSVPVNSFIGPRFDVFEMCLKGYPKKAICEIIGPTMNLADRYLKRIKKKRVEIIPF